VTDLGALALAVAVAVAAWLHRPRPVRLNLVQEAETIGRGMTALARAIRYQARVRGGLVQPPPEPQPERPPEMQPYDAWIDANITDPRERDDFRGMYEALLGLREAGPGSLVKYMRRLHVRGAPAPGQFAPTPQGVS